VRRYCAGTLEPVAQLIAREGDRIRSHGFVFVWIDTWCGSLTNSEFCVTLGFLNPYIFLPDAIASGILATPTTMLADFLLDDERLPKLQHSFGPFADVAEKALRLLRDYSIPEWDMAMDWKGLRQFSSPLRHRAIPVMFEFWGSLGEYAREIVVNPAARQYFMPELERRALVWSDKAIAVPILDQISGVDLFEGGEFRCSDLFYFGTRLGALTSACFTLQQGHDLEGTNVEALFEWSKLDIVAALREIRYRYMAAKQLSVAPPTITLRAAGQAGEMIQEIEALAQWVILEFLGSDNDVHRRFFRLGLDTFSLLDDAFQSRGNTSLVEASKREAVCASREFLTSLAADLDNGQLASGTSEKLTALLTSSFSISPSKKSLKDSIMDAPDQRFIETFPVVLLEATDELVPSAMHDLTLPASMEVVDWDWLKEQITKLREQGVKYPAVQLNPDGSFVTTILAESIGKMLCPKEEDVEVFFLKQFLGIQFRRDHNLERLGFRQSIEAVISFVHLTGRPISPPGGEFSPPYSYPHNPLGRKVVSLDRKCLGAGF
jgi:hypothetical protein